MFSSLFNVLSEVNFTKAQTRPLLQFYVSFSFGTYGHVLDFAFARVFEILDIIERLFGKILLLAALGNIGVPAFHRFEHGLAFVEQSRGGESIDFFAVERVRRADFDFVVIGKHVELRERDFVRALTRMP